MAPVTVPGESAERRRLRQQQLAGLVLYDARARGSRARPIRAMKLCTDCEHCGKARRVRTKPWQVMQELAVVRSRSRTPLRELSTRVASTGSFPQLLGP